jgi:calcineurin-like phosphoesterase family protein
MKFANYSRRCFLKDISAGVCACMIPVYLSGCNKAYLTNPAGSLTKIRFGVCADVHKDVIHDADQRMKVFVDVMNQEKVDFIIQLGDFCRPYEYNQSFIDIWNGFRGPRYHVLGNHDTDGGFTRQETLKFWAAKEKYYSFDTGGYHFVILDCNDKKDPSQTGYANWIGPRQLTWLEKDLAAAHGPVILFSHQPLNCLDNADEITGVLNNANADGQKVISCFAGHYHDDVYEVIAGIHYVRINSMSYKWMGEQFKYARFDEEIERKYPWLCCTSPYKDPLYAIVTLDPAGLIKISGTNSEWIPPTPWQVWNVPQKSESNTVPYISDRTLNWQFPPNLR